MERHGQEIKLNGDGDVVEAWKSGLALGRRLGFGPFKQACLSTAVLELSRHVVESGGGTCVLADESDGRVRRARATFQGERGELLVLAKQRLAADTAIGPAMPAVKLGEVVETCDLEPAEHGARIALTINESRPARPVPGRRW